MTAPDSSTPSTSTSALHELKTQIQQATQAMNPIANTINHFHKEMAKGEQDVHFEIQKLYDEMHARQIVHETEMGNIDSLVERFADQGIHEGIEDTIKPEMIDAIVRQRVANELENHMSKRLLKELDQIYREIERVQLELFNSEHRRQNSFLKFGGATRVVLNPIKKANGNVSVHFPKTLGDLSRLDGETVALLMIDYEISSAEDAMPLSLNRFMQFCGVRYQKVEDAEEDAENSPLDEQL